MGLSVNMEGRSRLGQIKPCRGQNRWRQGERDEEEEEDSSWGRWRAACDWLLCGGGTQMMFTQDYVRGGQQQRRVWTNLRLPVLKLLLTDSVCSAHLWLKLTLISDIFKWRGQRLWGHSHLHCRLAGRAGRLDRLDDLSGGGRGS